MKKIFITFTIILGLFTIVEGNLLDKIQRIDMLMQNKKFSDAEGEAKRVLTDPNITSDERASVENLLKEIMRKRMENQQSEIQNIIEENLVEKEGTEETTEEVLTTKEDVSDGSKFSAYDEYERAALATRNPDTIFKMANLYFRDGLYQRAVEVAKKDRSGSIPNLYAVAIGSRLIGKYEQSIEYYNKILSKNGREYEARLGRGIAYKNIGEFEKALSDLKVYAGAIGNGEVNNAVRELQNLVSNK